MRYPRFAPLLVLPLAFGTACGSGPSSDGLIGHEDASGSSSGAGGADGGGAENGGTLTLPDASFGGKPPVEGPDGSCGQSVIDSEPRTVNVLLVVDRSGSMTAALDGATRWKALRDALKSSLNQTKDAISYGVDLFPSQGCNVPSDPALAVAIAQGATNTGAVVKALDDAAPVPQGGTPTAAALGRALAYFQTGPGSALTGDRFVLLATDGGPNCDASHAACGADSCVVNMEGSCPIPNGGNCCEGDSANCLDDAATVARIEALAGAGVHTFVVGIPGSEAFKASLDAFAVAGKEARAGSTRYYAVTSSAELSDTLQGITRGLVKTCDLVLQKEPPDPGALNVEIDGTVIPQEGPDGWALDVSTSPPVVHLKGKTCESVESKGAENVRIVYGCPTVRVR